MSETTLSRCRVVLVKTHYAGNLGSVARVMRNFGLHDLVLVDPYAKRESMDAVMMAVHGVDILKSARIVGSLAEALADCPFVIATSGEIGGLIRKDFWGEPDEKVPAILNALDRGKAAIVFGPEPSGLTVEEIADCHGMIFIPADESYPSLNLAQSVAVCLYELRKQWLRREPQNDSSDPPAPYEEQERLFAHLKEALISIRFLWDFRSDGIFHVLRHIIVRSMPSSKELRILHGLSKQILYVANRWGVIHPDEGRPPPPPEGLRVDTKKARIPDGEARHQESEIEDERVE